MQRNFSIRFASRRAFTLLELLIAITILAMLSALSLGMLRNVAEFARIDRTKVMVTKLDTLVMERYNGYLTRTVPVRLEADVTPQAAMYVRLALIHELMRMEMPDRISDLANPPQTVTVTFTNASGMSVTRNYTLPWPALYRAMRAKADPQWLMKTLPAHSANESAECLYLMLQTMNSNGRSPIDSFSSSEVGDVDGDGMKEILDAWGQPIQFLRWAPGFTTENNCITTQRSSVDPSTSLPYTPDPFDPMRVDAAWGASSTQKPFALKPLIFSGGRDRHYDINVGTLDYSTTNPPSYPYYSGGAGYKYPGIPEDTDGDGSMSHYDNITNHYVETP